MTLAAGLRTGLLASLKRRWTNDCGSQIVELALSLPLLVFFVVGIFDFSGALTLKQKLTNAAREGARVSAADPASDMYATVPVSVSDAVQVVDNYLYSEKINDCGLGPIPAAPTQTNLTWTYTRDRFWLSGNGDQYRDQSRLLDTGERRISDRHLCQNYLRIQVAVQQRERSDAREISRSGHCYYDR